jgi:pimeloyl-ACP methyl ester carboxylesterase
VPGRCSSTSPRSAPSRPTSPPACRAKGRRHAEIGWGGEIAARDVRFVFSNEPVERLALLGERVQRLTNSARHHPQTIVYPLTSMHAQPSSTTPADRQTLDVDGETISYLTAGDAEAPTVVLVHGTYWSRVWQPVIGLLADAGLRPVAVDLPGLGRSSGELTLKSATVPALADWVARFVEVLEPKPLAGVAGHDIGGAIAQRLLVASTVEVPRLALLNSVTYDSWPVPGVARYRDPAVVEATTNEYILEARRTAITAAIGRPASEAELADYLSPWTEMRVARSWMAMAGAADDRYTLELVDALRGDERPKLVIWGEDDRFQLVHYAERFAAEMPATELIRVPDAGHIPMENDPDLVGGALARFFAP